jgi:tRNA(fMet)-specific endonuclease VapC
MSLFVFDTDMLTLAQWANPQVVRRIGSCLPSQLATTILSVQEQLDGWHGQIKRAKSPQKLAQIYQRFTDSAQYLSRLSILSFTEPAILRYQQLRSLKLNIGKMDLRIAAIVLELNATMVSRNLRDFQRITGLLVEDWSK